MNTSDTPGRDGGSPSVAVLGGGLMATEIINCLARSGLTVRVFNRSPERVQHLAAERVTIWPTAAQAADEADAVLSCVADDEASQAVWTGPAGALAVMRAGTIAVELSTVSADHVSTWAAVCRSHGVRPLDVAVTGSVPRARQGTLIGFAGGDAEDLTQARPVIAAFTEHVIHFGASGAGMRYKLAHNLAAATALLGLAESLSLAAAAGLDTAQALTTLSTYGWAAPVAQSMGPRMLSGDHSTIMCSLDTIAKDIRYALRSLADRGGDDAGKASLPLTRTVLDRMETAIRAGGTGQEMSAVCLAYEPWLPAPLQSAVRPEFAV
ncbi:NAD(P)-binding domain-containing protein [Streptomyces sp. NBC_00513]|uniref:NAD(P)-dependent oxidoreductase n=1 Tax=unclassified Streptomyces TaxID=2593676 RepID=UPI00224F7208|nr:NAD(P)-binding domain-containing protein [Streptomyces sp. NBC_00424]MCX5071093.1 NAD(P)-binding domain-containing protein [Streptomyces sp. NBC_00424]WUD45483.1 NAD(P)-binding domain-containing protein [Streptomyces sp. NBC_00513]